MKKGQSRAPTTCIHSFFWDMGLLPGTKEVAKMCPWHSAWALLSLRYLTHQVASQPEHIRYQQESGRWAHALRWTSGWGQAFWTLPLFSVLFQALPLGSV